ncbi:RING-type domain-containing protein [Mycena kentingensis (nom. inval.)]|nr:RING-type domain-containing protein [Mycena kentingensis (nom. inval.)]
MVKKSPQQHSKRFSQCGRPDLRFLDPAEADFRALVYDSLTSIIHTNVAALNYNAIFGQLWRAVCKYTGDATRKTELVNAFSEQVGKISDAAEKAALRQWLEESFDMTEEIQAIVKRHLAGLQATAPPQMVYLDFDTDIQLARTELLEVSRSCYSGVMKKIARVFTHLKLVEEGVMIAPTQHALPVSLPAKDFFRLLPHLIVPGTLYPPRAAALTAVVALIVGVPFNLDAPVEVKMPWTPQKTRGPGDVKVECKKCGVCRSVTIMSHIHGDLCGFCASSDLSARKIAELYPEVDVADSCWVECSTKTCRAQYVVEQVAALKIRPRCHYCRNSMRCPWLECSSCASRVIVPTAHRSGKFTCSACTNPEWASKAVAVEETTTRALNAENGVEWLGFGKADNGRVFEGKSAFKLMQAFGEGVFAKEPADGIVCLTLQGKRVHEPKAVLREVEARVGRGEVILASCALCFEEMPQSKLMPACGRSGCAQLVDEACLREWYASNRPGRLLNMAQFTCCFCRRKPTLKTMTRFNPSAATLGGMQAAMEDRRFLYAWCLDCGDAKRVYERVCCNEEGVPPIVDFCCEDCRAPPPPPVVRRRERNGNVVPLHTAIRDAAKFRLKTHSVKCPNPACGYIIEKESGCNHVVCVCGTHFCYACGNGFASSAIYEHMTKKHGSWYGN